MKKAVILFVCSCKIYTFADSYHYSTIINKSFFIMTKKYPLSYLGTVALLSLSAIGGANAQVSNYIKLPDSYQVEKERMTPKQLQERLAEAKAKHPLRYMRVLPSSAVAKHDGLTRINGKASTTQQSAQGISNTIMRVASEDGRKLWGNVLFDNTWASVSSDYYAYGWYEFMAKKPVKVNQIFTDDFFRATGSGAWIGNNLYFIMYQNFWGIDMIYYYKYNTDTWTKLVEQSTKDYSLIANETAVAPDGETVYGDYLNADGTGNELCKVNYETLKRTKIGDLRQAYVAMGMTKEGVLYGVATDGNLYKIDTTTAEETLIGSTGKQLKLSDGSFYYQSGEIDQKTNTFYWACVDANKQSTLYTVDLADASLSLVGDFEGQNMITMLSIPKPAAEDGAPASAENLSFDFKNGSLTGDVCFTIPTKTFAGGELTGDISYTITDGTNTLAEGKAAPGAEVRQSVTLKDNGTVNFIVTLANEVGTSPRLLGSKYVGMDKPKSAGDVKSTLDDATGKVTVTWTAPTEGLYGGYMGDITYNIVRYPDGKLLKENYAGTTYSETLPADVEKSVYGYGITPVNGSMKGDESVSNYVAFGKAITPPFYGGFDDASEMALYNIIDGNGDGVTWAWEEPNWSNDQDASATTARSENGSADEWLITPALKVKAGYVYNVSFRVKCYSKYYPQKLEVKYGSSATASGMTETLLPAETLTTSEYLVRKATLAPTKDGEMFVGFHDISDKGQQSLKIDDISIGEGISVSAPDSVSELSVSAGAKGALQATLSFKAPDKTYSGGKLDKITKFLIRRTGKVVAEAPAAEPGSVVTFTDNTAVNGINIYSVAAVNESGSGFYCTPKAVYVGKTAPSLPENRRTAEHSDKVTFSWEEPTVGLYDGYVDPSGVTYVIAERSGSDYYPTYDAVDSVKAKTTIDIPMVTNTGDQSLKTLFISAKNEYGQSSYKAMPSIMLGKPYEIPFAESASQNLLHGRLWTTYGTGKSDFWTIDDNYPDCVDNDGGAFHMISEANDDWAYLGTGKIALAGAAEPKLIFYHKAAANSGAKIKIEVELPDGTTKEVANIDAAKDGGNWTASAVSLADFAEEEFLSVNFVAQANKGEVVYIDRMFIRDTYTYDLNAEIEAPEKAKKGDTETVKVTINNFGSKDARGYKVELYANGELVETKTPSEPLKAYCFETFNFEYKSNILDDKEAVDLKAIVIYNNDLNTDDNEVSTSTKFELSSKPRPEAATAKETEGGVEIAWTAVDSSSKTTTDSFESYTPWSTDVFGDWKSVANITGTTGGPLTIKYPSQGTSFAFTLADPLSNWLTASQLEQLPGFKAHTGNKYLASFFRADNDGNNVSQDNWLFSPELSGEKQTITFWVKNENDEQYNKKYPETFNVLYSTTNREQASFTKIGDTHTTSKAEWEEVSVELPAGTKYFAINQNTNASDAFVFMIDDITYTFGPGAVTEYNIYRDGTLVGTVSADKTSFVDNTAKDNTTYVYGVTAVYADGESEAAVATAITTGVESIFASGKAYDVYTVDGICVAKNVKNLSTLKKGVYVIDGKKVVVK